MTGTDSVDLSAFVKLPCYVFTEIIELLDSTGHFEHAYALLRATGAPYVRKRELRLKRLATARPFNLCLSHRAESFEAKLVDINLDENMATVQCLKGPTSVEIDLSAWYTIAGKLKRGPIFPPGVPVYKRYTPMHLNDYRVFTTDQAAMDPTTGNWMHRRDSCSLVDSILGLRIVDTYWLPEDSLYLESSGYDQYLAQKYQEIFAARFEYLVKLDPEQPLPRFLDVDVVRIEKKATARAQKLHASRGQRVLRPLPRKVRPNKLRVGQRRKR